MNKEILDRDVNLHITFNRYETLNAVKQAAPGDLIIQDEDSRLSGHDQVSMQGPLKQSTVQ